MEVEPRVSDRIIVAVLVASLALGLVLYGWLVPASSGDAAAAPVAATTPTGETASAPPAGAPSSPVPTWSRGGSRVGSDPAVRDEGAVAGSSTAPTPAPAPAPAIPTSACPTDAGSDLYESVIDPLSDALGEELPRDNVRLLAQIAAGCDDESPGSPVLGLALDIGRLVPSTGLPNLDLRGIPAVPAPAIPDAVIDALAPLQPTIMEGCGTVGLLGVLLAVLPGAANLPISGSDLVDLVVPATTLCAQFEG